VVNTSDRNSFFEPAENGGTSNVFSTANHHGADALALRAREVNGQRWTRARLRGHQYRQAIAEARVDGAQANVMRAGGEARRQPQVACHSPVPSRCSPVRVTAQSRHARPSTSARRSCG